MKSDGQTDGQTDRVTTVGTLSGFQDFFLQPIVKDRPNNSMHSNVYVISNISIMPHHYSIELGLSFAVRFAAKIFVEDILKYYT